MPFVSGEVEALDAGTSGKFITGPQVVSYSRCSQEPIKLLESITPLELASCVPFVRITQIDPRTGHQIDGAKPIMFDLVASRRFDEPSERFLERTNVSLKGIEVRSKLATRGTLTFKEIDISFRVHKPEAVFNRSTDLAWRTLMDEGSTQVLEYGWVADPRVVKNDLFNGIGIIDQATGLSIRSIRSMLLTIARYEVTLTTSGEVDVILHAYENGDLALRESRLGDVLGIRRDEPDKKVRGEIATSVKRMIDSMPKVSIKSRGNLVKMIDILNTMVADQVFAAAKMFGYSSTSFFCGNFNERAESSSDQYGRIDLSKKSIGDFLVPIDVIRKVVTDSLKHGQVILLINFIEAIISVLNSGDAWATPKATDRMIPNIEITCTTFRDPTKGTTRLIVQLTDRIDGYDRFMVQDKINIDKQTRSNVFAKLASMNVPILEFGKGTSLITDASFQIQMDPMLQHIQIEQAYKGRSDKAQIANIPNIENRQGMALPRELIPISTLEGTITMVGNFVLDTLSAIWIEFYGASQISGFFTTTEKTDTIEPGRFRSQYKMISSAYDPLNTRLKRTEKEFADEKKAADALKNKKK